MTQPAISPLQSIPKNLVTDRQSLPNQRTNRRLLVERHSDLVKMVARQVGRSTNLQRASMDVDDLFSVGILGLFDASDRYDPETGCPFPKFAEFRIRGAMLDEIRRRDTMPRRLRAQASRLAKIEIQLRRTNGEAVDADVAEAMELNVAELSRLRQRIDSFKFVSTDQGLPVASASPQPEDVVEFKEKVDRLYAAIDELPDRERKVVVLYFGREQTLQEIADDLGVTEGRVSQIKSAATKRLRVAMTA